MAHVQASTPEAMLPPILSPRTASMVLAAFPWRTDLIMRPSSIVDALMEDAATSKDVFLLEYARNVSAYEKQVRSRSTTDAEGLWNALEIRPGPANKPVNHEKDKAHRFHWFSSMRLMDFNAKVLGYISKVPIPRQLRSPELTTTCVRFRQKMPNWVYAWQVFKGCIDGMNITVLPDTTDEDLPVRVLKSILRTDKMNRASNIIQNFELAAIYLIYVGRDINWDSALPDMPSNGQDVISVVTQNHGGTDLASKFTDDELGQLREVLKDMTAAQLRLPINIAVMVTPLVLLLPVKVCSWSWVKQDMLQFSKQLGNVRPDVLASLEESVMRELTNIATGRCGTVEAVMRLASSVDMEALEQCDKEVAEWFLARAPSALKSTTLLDMNLEEPLDPEWPLATQMQAELGDAYKIKGVTFGELAGGPPTPAPSAEEETGGDPSQASASNGCDQHDAPLASSSVIPKPATPTAAGSKPAPPRRSRRARDKAAKKRSEAKLVALKAESSKPEGIPLSLTKFGPGSVFYNPIDIDGLHTPMSIPNLTVSNTVKKYTDKVAFAMFGPAGKMRRIKAVAHYDSDLAHLGSFYEEMRGTYVNGKALHVARPEHSAYKVLTQTEFAAMPVREVQELLRTQHLVLTDVPGRIAFDDKGLGTLRNLSNTISIQDHSVAVSESQNVQLKDGTLQDLLDSAMSSKGKILNALDFPMGWAGWYPSQITTELIAWRATEGMPFAKDDTELPVAHYRFGLAATTGATSWWHLDGPFGTTLNVVAGEKVLFTARPICKEGVPLTPESFNSFGSLALFLNEDFDMEDGFNPFWQVEGICLPAGTTFIMRPNTPHCAYTSNNAIVYGSHFWCTSTMTDAAFGLIHSFVSPNLLAKTRHPGSRRMIQRIVMFYHRGLVDNALKNNDPDRAHLPVLTNIDDAIALMTIALQAIFINVLDQRTYEMPPGPDAKQLHHMFDVNGLSCRNRRAYVFVRRLAFQLLRWFSASYTFMTPGGKELEGWSDIIVPYIIRQSRAILRYKFLSNDEGFPGATHETVHMQMMACLDLFPEIFDVSDDGSQPPSDLACAVDRDILITKRSTPNTLAEISEDWGLTQRDLLFFGYTASVEGDEGEGEESDDQEDEDRWDDDQEEEQDEGEQEEEEQEEEKQEEEEQEEEEQEEEGQEVAEDENNKTAADDSEDDDEESNESDRPPPAKKRRL